MAFSVQLDGIGGWGEVNGLLESGVQGFGLVGVLQDSAEFVAKARARPDKDFDSDAYARKIVT